VKTEQGIIVRVILILKAPPRLTYYKVLARIIMAPYSAIFIGALLVNIVATFRSSSYWGKFKLLIGFVSRDDGTELSESDDVILESPFLKEKHAKILRKYLAVYITAIFSDWIQGPYVYALYDEYGFSQHEIALLFVAGFASSMVFGTFVGGLADSCGRKKFTIAFTVIYGCSCITKHFRDFGVLLLGRLLGGISTSLLFSVFDSWLIKSHSEAGISAFLSKSFATAQYWNAIAAISAGLIANKATEFSDLRPVGNLSVDEAIIFKGGTLMPFDIALFVLSACAILASTLWSENYGNDRSTVESDHEKRKHWYSDILNAFYTTISSKQILYTGLICSLFEGSMYIFVFMWTPAIKELGGGGEMPFGVLFATFMVSCMAGSSIFSIFIGSVKNEKIGLGVFLAATITFALMTLAQTDTSTIIAFLLFEACVGCYFPMMGTMKSLVVPENKRAAIYNLYRIPLNFIVLFSLLTDLSPKASFTLCSCMLATATFLQWSLMKHQESYFSTSDNKTADLEEGKSLLSEELTTRKGSVSKDDTPDEGQNDVPKEN